MKLFPFAKVLMISSLFHLNFLLASSFINFPSIQPCGKVHDRRQQFSIFSTTETISDNGTIRVIENTKTQEKVTIIGTAHLSQASNDQVRTIIESTDPDAILVELDLSRLERIGMENGVKDLNGLPFSTAENIAMPLSDDDIKAEANRNWFTSPLSDGFLDLCTSVARKGLTQMYNDMGESMGGLKAGGEFLEAINAAKSRPSCRRIIFGDRESVATIRRAGELALRGGDPIGVLGRLIESSNEEMTIIDAQIRKELNESEFEGDDFESAVKVATVERMKGDATIRESIFSKLEKDVPEFTLAFITERDYIMAKAIEDELKIGKSKNIVAVVGAAHAPGMAKNLLNNM